MFQADQGVPDREPPKALDQVEIRQLQHELLNKLSVVTAYCHLLLEEQLSADQSEMVNEIDVAAAKLKELAVSLTADPP